MQKFQYKGNWTNLSPQTLLVQKLAEESEPSSWSSGSTKHSAPVGREGWPIYFFSLCKHFEFFLNLYLHHVNNDSLVICTQSTSIFRFLYSLMPLP